MYKFSRSSALYRLAHYTGDVPRNFCPLVRRAILGGFILAFITFLCGSVVIFNILGVLTAFQGIWFVDDVTSVFFAINCVSIAFGTMIGTMLLNDWRIRRAEERRRAEIHRKFDDPDYTPSQPSTLTIWWRSVHDKICPSIEIVD
jgi:hypothetical protein